MAYSATGEQKYFDTLVNAYDWLMATQIFATGGYGPEENLVVPDGSSRFIDRPETQRFRCGPAFSSKLPVVRGQHLRWRSTLCGLRTGALRRLDGATNVQWSRSA